MEYSQHLIFFLPVIYVINEGQKGLCSSRNETGHPLIDGYEALRRFIFRAPLFYKYAHAPPRFIFHFTKNLTQSSSFSFTRPSPTSCPFILLLRRCQFSYCRLFKVTSYSYLFFFSFLQLSSLGHQSSI